MTNRLFIPATLLVFASSSALGEVRYRVRPIPRLSIGTQYTEPKDINASGVVVGLDDQGTGNAFAYQWIPQTNQIFDLGSLPVCQPFGAHVEAINDFRHAAGTDGNQDCESVAWWWTTETGMIEIGDLPGGPTWSEAYDINNLDEIVGRSLIEPASTRAFLWTPEGGMISLGTLPGGTSEAHGINDASWVVGESAGKAFLWRPGEGMMPLGGPDGVAGPDVNGVANDINEVGQVTGWFIRDYLFQPFLWDSLHGAIPLGRLRPEYTQGRGEALGINNFGQVVGVEYVGSVVPNGMVPIIWDERRGLRDLTALIDPCYRPGSDTQMIGAVAINDDGWIAMVRIVGRGAVLIPYIPGDLDPIAGSTTVGDGDVDLQDLANMLSSFGRTDANYAAGDLDCDQDVDLEDLTILLSNFGETLP